MPPNVRFPATSQRAHAPRQVALPKVSERDEPTMDFRWYFETNWEVNRGPGYKGRLQQRWLISQVHAQNNARSRPVEVRAEWRDVPNFFEPVPPTPPDLKAEKERLEALQTKGTDK